MIDVASITISQIMISPWIAKSLINMHDYFIFMPNKIIFIALTRGLFMDLYRAVYSGLVTCKGRTNFSFPFT